MLAPVGEANFGEERLSALLVEAARAWPDFARELESAAGTTVGYRRDGTLLVAVDPSDGVAVAELLEYRRSLGLGATVLGAAAARAAEPLLAPAIRGGAELHDDHQVDNRRLVGALLAVLSRRGVELVAARASRLLRRGDRVAGAELEDGRRLASATVVVAAGCWSGQLDGWPEPLRPPVRPVKGLTLRLAAGGRAAPLRRPVRGVVHGRSCYLVPREEGTLVVGATVEERGFDLRVEAGPVGDLLDDARRLVPSVEAYELLETSAGLRPGSPDNAPMVGACLPGLVVATGHYRNGILLAPLTAAEVARLLEAGADPAAGEGGPSPFAAFRPTRFAATTGVSGDGPTGAGAPSSGPSRAGPGIRSPAPAPARPSPSAP